MTVPRNTASSGAEATDGAEAAGTESGAEWRAETLCADEALTVLASEWEELYRRCPTATPFTSQAWLESWWRGYGRPGRLVVVLVRRAGRLVGAAALMRRRRGAVPVLSAVGAGISDFCDMLLDDACADEAAGHLARELAIQARGRVVDLVDVPPAAATWRVVDAWPGRLWQLPSSPCLYLPAVSMDELIGSLPLESARTRRTKHRRIEATGIQSHVVSGQEATDAITSLLRLHYEQWRGRGINPEHRRPRFAAHLARAVPTLVERGQAVLVEYRIDGQLVLVEVVIIGHRMVGAYLYGFRPELRRRIDVTQLLLGNDLELTRRLGVPTLSMLRGDEPHKRQWRPREARNQRVLLAGAGCPLAPLYAAGAHGRYRLAEFVKARLPRIAKAIRSARKCLPSFM